MKDYAGSGLAVVLPLAEEPGADVVELEPEREAREEAIVCAAAELHGETVLAVARGLREGVGAAN